MLLGVLGIVGSCCGLPVIGAVVGYSASAGESRRRTFMIGASFLVGTAMASAAVTVVVGLLGKAAGAALGKYWTMAAGFVAVAFGLAMLGLAPFRLPSVCIGDKGRPRGLASAVGFGLIVGGSVMACSMLCNPLLLAPAIAAAAVPQKILLGAAILAAFSLGFSLPPLAILLGLSLGQSAIKTAQAAKVIKAFGGLLLIAVGFYMLATFR
jgi:cytochrome c-type biogenesis protein